TGRLSLFRGPGCVLNAVPLSQNRFRVSTVTRDRGVGRCVYQIFRERGFIALPVKSEAAQVTKILCHSTRLRAGKCKAGRLALFHRGFSTKSSRWNAFGAG